MNIYYKVDYTDDTTFIGGSPDNSKWNEQPNKRIARIRYYIEKYIIILSGYTNYNHIVDLVGIAGGNTKIVGVKLFGTVGNKTDGIEINFKTKQIVEFSEENPLKYTGWKNGTLDLSPSKVVKLKFEDS